MGCCAAALYPPRPVRELRDLTRHRSKLSQQRATVANRVQKVLEDANIKLGSVASNVLGRSGVAILQALIAGQQDVVVLADMARGRLKSKTNQLRKSLEGRLTDHHRFLLGELMNHSAVSGPNHRPSLRRD